jgi:hypothetical protein
VVIHVPAALRAQNNVQSGRGFYEEHYMFSCKTLNTTGNDAFIGINGSDFETEHSFTPLIKFGREN